MSHTNQSIMHNCKCLECGAGFSTAAPSRIKEPLCVKCLAEERKKPASFLVPDFAKAAQQLRKELGISEHGCWCEAIHSKETEDE